VSAIVSILKTIAFCTIFEFDGSVISSLAGADRVSDTTVVHKKEEVGTADTMGAYVGDNDDSTTTVLLVVGASVVGSEIGRLRLVGWDEGEGVLVLGKGVESALGCCDGRGKVGRGLGGEDGEGAGIRLGVNVGWAIGVMEGSVLGSGDGEGVGASLGVDVDWTEGLAEGGWVGLDEVG
jgi:hypothetical protein